MYQSFHINQWIEINKEKTFPVCVFKYILYIYIYKHTQSCMAFIVLTSV